MYVVNLNHGKNIYKKMAKNGIKIASCRDCPCDSASCRDSRQEAKSHGQSLQEAFYQAQQSGQEARDRGQSRRKPNITDSLCRKRQLADSFIPCENISQNIFKLELNSAIKFTLFFFSFKYIY